MNPSEIFNTTEYIFSDFDGTISKFDVIHKFIRNFSKGDYMVAEKLWCEGKMSTQDCLKIQFDMITGLTKEVFDKFVETVEIDPYFYEFYKLAKSLNKKIIVLSDGFDLFIKPTLKKYQMDDIQVFANVLKLKEENGFIKFEMEYPNQSKNCLIGSGCCKCEVAQQFTRHYTYIGDGLSDRCIAKKSALLFAKKSLETFCANENIKYFPYTTFQDIINAVCKENLNAADDVKQFNRGCN